MLSGQFGRAKEDCLEAKKYKVSEQGFTILIRSRIFVEKYKEALAYAEEGLKTLPESRGIKELKAKAEREYKEEQKRVEQISTVSSLAQDKKY